MKKPSLVSVYRGIILPGYVGIAISHSKDSRIPIKQPVFHGKLEGFFRGSVGFLFHKSLGRKNQVILLKSLVDFHLNLLR